MASFDLDKQVALNPRTTNRVYIASVSLDAVTGVLSWLAFDNPQFTGTPRAYSATLTGPQLSAVATIVKNTMGADIGALVT